MGRRDVDEGKTGPVRRAVLAARGALRASRWLQVLVIAAFWGAGEWLVRAAHAPFPGSIAGLLALLALLATGALDVRNVERGAGVLLGEMLLFFVPAVVAVVAHPEWAGVLGLKLLVAILAGTLAVMLVTGTVVELCFRLMRSREGRTGDAR